MTGTHYWFQHQGIRGRQISLRSRLAWSTWQIQGKSLLYDEVLSYKKEGNIERERLCSLLSINWLSVEMFLECSWSNMSAMDICIQILRKYILYFFLYISQYMLITRTTNNPIVVFQRQFLKHLQYPTSIPAGQQVFNFTTSSLILVIILIHLVPSVSEGISL